MMENETVSNDTSDHAECAFDPYWIYALVVPFLGVLFNGLLLFICASIAKGHRPRRRAASVAWTHQLTEHLLHSKPAEDAATTPFCNRTIESDSNRRPEFALNWFVANSAVSTLVASCLRTITISYLFTLNVLLCPAAADQYDDQVGQAMEILLYAQHSIFNVAYVNFLIVLNLDKLLFIVKPLHYRSFMTRKRVIVVCVATWLLSSAWLPLYFSQNEADAVRWGTILVTVLMVGPSVFCLVTSTILAVVVFRVQMRDRVRKDSNNHGETSSTSYYWVYCKSVFRLFQSVLWTCVTSLPHPLAIIISYYTSVSDPSAHAVLKFVIGYLSIAYFSGMPFMIMLTYPAYWRHLKLYCV